MKKSDSKHYFVCGIGGSGMNAIAALLQGYGHHVSGSDRAYDEGKTPEKFMALKNMGIALFPQDGSGITDDIDYVVASAAVESKIADIIAAKEKGISILGKAQLLATLLNDDHSIAVAGTSGKTTVTGMVAFVMRSCGVDVGMMCGGQVVNFIEEGLPFANALTGRDVFIAETDESDGSVNYYSPYITVINNITLDHKPIAELREIFKALLERTRHKIIMNIDDVETAGFYASFPAACTFSIKSKRADFFADNIEKGISYVTFTVYHRETAQKADVRLNMPGGHNVSNALATIAACVTYGMELKDVCAALSAFKGIKRRFEIVGVANSITVIDDFGHNPDKIAATLKTLKDFDGRILMMYQPHGFGPTKMMKEDLIKVFSEYLGEEDVLLMPEIYYAGGTADKSISSRDIIDAVAESGKKTVFFESRNEVKNYIKQIAQPLDRIVIMGARDDTLSEFARSILEDMRREAA